MQRDTQRHQKIDGNPERESGTAKQVDEQKDCLYTAKRVLRSALIEPS